MTTDPGQPADVSSLVNKLVDAAKSVAKDDLAVLAKMHSWCEEVAEGAQKMGSDAAPEIRTGAVNLAPMLEAIILGDAPDPEAALQTVVETTRELAALVGIEPSSKTQKPAAKKAASKGRQPLETSSKSDTAVPTPPSASAAPTPPAPPTASGAPAAPAGPAAAGASQTTAQAQPPAYQKSDKAAATASPQTGAAPEPPYESAPLKIDAKEMEFIKSFLEEAREHIEAIESALLDIERAPSDASIIDNLFRPFHTIKGMAGFLNLRDISSLTHEAETLLDQARKGKRQITPGLIDLVFDVVDILKAQLTAIAAHVADPKGDIIDQPPVTEIIGKLRDVIAGRLEPGAREPTAGSPSNRVGENLVEQGACGKDVVDVALDAQKKMSQPKRTGEILVEIGAATPKQVSQAIRPQTHGKTAAGAAASAAPADQSIRIDTGKLDSLVDMVGELVIAQTLVGASSAATGSAKLAKDVDQVTKIVRDVQEVAMSMRMIPIGPTFQKMARLVRDVSRKASKKVELIISGEDTEMDKNMIQQIGDPLIHMVRNAIDHGVETSEERIAAGKNETGQVRLSAYHHGGNIVVEVADDGKGLDAKKLIAKGIEKGLVQPGEELTPQQAYALVFAPGFSTARTVTDISGRGVGMDVVRRNIEQLRGKVDIVSEVGKGSTFSIRLPLTLAIIDGMVIKVGPERFIIPTIAIEQALRPRREQITTVQKKGEVLNVRGRLIPLIQLGALFNLTGRINPCEAMVVIATTEDRQIGLVVSELIGQQQVVIKTLGERFEHLRGIAGAAILGDGRVGLILEMSGLATAHASLPAKAIDDAPQTQRPTAAPEQPVEPAAPLANDHQAPNETAPALASA